jgi:tetratricopeptide (TPR) repeat protein
MRAKVWMAKQEVTRAMADFDQAIKLDPRFVEAYHNRGIAYLMIEKLPEAEADFARCRALGGTLSADVEQLRREVKARHRQ